ncbi:carboxypeptidase regulatory-like domain-containing protein [bacterium]|nr:carboxypeptidase regulatory-like domain-containing protein [bacterium]
MKSLILLLTVILLCISVNAQLSFCYSNDNEPEALTVEILNGIENHTGINTELTVARAFELSPTHYEFCYREFISVKKAELQGIGPERRLRHRNERNTPRRDEEVFIDFDDRDVGSNWGAIEVLHDFYEDLGVNFRGNNDVNGGGVINEAGNFGVNGHSSPNFLAFNTGGRYQNGGIASPPEYIIFDDPVDLVTILAGSSRGGQVTMTAYDAEDEEIADTDLNMQAGMQEMTIEQSGIAYVVIETGVAVFVLDDLFFANLAELVIAPEDFDLIVPVGDIVMETITIGNIGEGDLVFEIDDEGDDPDWLSFEPVEGSVEPEDEMEIEVIISAEDLDPRGYDRTILFQCNDPDHQLVEIPVHIFVISGEGWLNGTVVDASEDNDPLEGVQLSLLGFDYEAFSDENGRYDFGEVPAWTYTLRTTIEDFLPYVNDEVVVEDGEETTLNIDILHSTFDPFNQNIITGLEPDNSMEIEFVVRNNGNGPLTWSVERVLPEGPEEEPWELRFMSNAEEIVEDDMLNGVTFADEHFFVSGGNSGDNPNMIYVFDTDGNYVRNFEQVHESRYGMRDLTFDGELIWGSDENVLYGYTTEGEHAATIEGDAGSYRSVTWDPENGLFWSADITSDIYATDLDGNLVRTVDRPGDQRIYGLAYWSEDPDGFNLYAFNRGVETDIQVDKLNLDNGDIMIAAEFDANGSRPGGIHITNLLDPYSWVFLGMLQSPDRFAIWQLETNYEWFRIDPEAGQIAAGESESLNLVLDATGISVENRLEGELVFTHDGIGGQTIVTVTMNVEEGEVRTFRDLHLHVGWNTVSVNIRPDNNENIRELVAPLVEEDLLVFMKNGDGEFYFPEYDFSNIPGWYVNEGYQLKMSGEAVLRIHGISVFRDEPIQLHEGWQLISYYPRFPIEATVALSGIEENLIIAKDGYGNFYIPDWDFSNMGNMCEGQGYYVNVDADVWLVYQLERPDEEGAFTGVRHSSIYDEPGQLPVHAVTGSNMSLLVLGNPPLLLQGGYEIGVYTDGKLVGSGVPQLRDGVCGIAIWGDDPSTDEIDGALEGQPLEIRLLTGEGGHSCPPPYNSESAVNYTLLSGEAIYHTDALSVIRLSSSTTLPVEFGISSAYPNPFNSVLRINYGLVKAGDVSLKVYDLTGRHVAELVKGNFKAGTHVAVFDGIDLSSGVYLLRLESGSDVSQMKVALVK